MKNGVERTSHQEAIKALRRLFHESYPDGGWLPPGREMAERLGVSHPTYCKALKTVQDEGFAISFPQRGHCVVSADQRHRKVGVIYSEGGASPLVAGLYRPFQHFADNGLMVQIIQSSSLDKLHHEAVIHGVEGLLWLFPPPKAVQAAREIQMAGDMPLVLMCPPWEDSLPGVGHVQFDFEQICRAKAEYMLERGHRSFVYIGDHASAERSGMVAAARAAGLELGPKRCVCTNDLLSNPGKLARTLRRIDCTAVFSGGGYGLRFLLEELSALPDGECQPEVLTDRFAGLDSFAARFPEVKLLTLPWPLAENLDLTGARMLAQHLLAGEKLGLVKVGVLRT